MVPLNTSCEDILRVLNEQERETVMDLGRNKISMEVKGRTRKWQSIDSIRAKEQLRDLIKANDLLIYGGISPISQFHFLVLSYGGGID